MTDQTTGTATPVLEAHQCQTGCGRIADAVLTQLDTSTVDILCNPCLMAMMMAVAAQLPDPAAPETVAADPNLV